MRSLGTCLLAAGAPWACIGSPEPGQGQDTQTSTKQERPAPPILPSEKDLGRRARHHVAKLVAFGPRVPGSRARRKAADYIAARLRALGLTPIREAWTDAKERIRFENLRVVFPGRSPKVLLIGTHYDTKWKLGDPARGRVFTGANDGGSGSGLLLALAEDLVHLGLERPSLELVWFDGEESLEVEWNVSRALFGSRKFVEMHLVKGHRYGAFVLLDMVGDRDLAIDLDERSTRALAEPIRDAAGKLGYSRCFFQKKTDVEDDHVPFLAAGLPSLDLIQFESNPRWHTYEDRLEFISARSLAIVGRTLLQALPEIETGFLR
ncbi:MAG: M28 family peptidase [Planctomycetota bacterium]